MKVVITGSKGKVGQAIVNNVEHDKFEIIHFDRPEYDAFNTNQLRDVFSGVDSVIHLAWANERGNINNNVIETENVKMAINVLMTAIECGVPKVILASSTRAHGYEIATDEVVNPSSPDKPECNYGKAMRSLEGFAQKLAEDFPIEVVVVRIGNVNIDDQPNDDEAHAMTRWISHRDFAQLVTKILERDPIPHEYTMVYGVSQAPNYSYENPFGYVPQDSSANLDQPV